MKSITTIIMINLLIVFGALGQKVAYQANGKLRFEKEHLSLDFSNPASDTNLGIPEEGKPELFDGLLPFLPDVIDLVFKVITDQLEKRIKKFSAEYIIYNSNVDPSLSIPKITVRRILDETNTVFTLVLEPLQVPGRNAFVYYVDELEVRASKALAKKNKNLLDYIVKIVPVVLDKKGEKSRQELTPMAITSISVGGRYVESNRSNPRYRTDFIYPGKGLIEMGLNVVETNSKKVKAEAVLASFNNYKDDVKTIINNVLPKEDNATEVSTDHIVQPNVSESNEGN